MSSELTKGRGWPIATTADLERLLNGGEGEPYWCRHFWSSFNDRLDCFPQQPRGYRIEPWLEARDADAFESRARMKLVRRENGSTVFLHPSLFVDVDIAKQHLITRMFITAIAISFADHYRHRPDEPIVACVSDLGMDGVPSFTATRHGSPLIPDAVFIHTLGYEAFKRAVNRRWVPWDARRKIAFWRGGLNGIAADPSDDWSWLPRAHLCSVTRSLRNSSMVDAKLTQIDPHIASSFEERLAGIGPLMGEPIEPIDHVEYRYLIDIDGWANAWSGLFQKLLTGSTVLKVASQKGFRQWYYDRLVPWVNYVPVRADFADLDDAIAFVLENDDRAREIGEAGRRLALSLNLESEIYGMAAHSEAPRSAGRADRPGVPVPSPGVRRPTPAQRGRGEIYIPPRSPHTSPSMPRSRPGLRPFRPPHDFDVSRRSLRSLRLSPTTIKLNDVLLTHDRLRGP